jgi:hypothetical protein
MQFNAREQGKSSFGAGALELYTALLAAGETEISRNLLKSTMNAAASVARLEECDGCYLEAGRSGERQLCEELLKKSLFWICQVPDAVAQEHGGEVFREALRLLLWVRQPVQAELTARETPKEGNPVESDEGRLLTR